VGTKLAVDSVVGGEWYVLLTTVEKGNPGHSVGLNSWRSVLLNCTVVLVWLSDFQFSYSYFLHSVK